MWDNGSVSQKIANFKNHDKSEATKLNPGDDEIASSVFFRVITRSSCSIRVHRSRIHLSINVQLEQF